ncbi:class I SAM-dependent methyltransferase [Polyangium jinanense]|uniref:Methyltransferase domain-containing protein n=1 Tax=Polyangium jinanense TaxID=2829994 RepID=A0A9X3X682_9BACT|nr:methyltransferase domain-containing protein [Polyangium jinanense]MDC3958609.1 methyltransferase domain-containing protein [Polyangium jinanense]MDC3983083.1 methyltransferase domain-containing protein [Polyangium jinanense]
MDRSAYDALFALEKDHFWRVARRTLLLEILEKELPARRPLRLLDVGGASSLITREMRRYGEVIMVEPDAQTAAFARDELGYDARVGSLPDALPVEGTFDGITLLDVLEHLDEEVPALLALKRLLRPDGLLLVTVPALPFLWSSHDVSVHHRRRYVRHTLLEALRAGGFEAERISYFTSLLLPVLAAQRIGDRLRRGVPEKAHYRVAPPPAPINAAFGAVMDLERALLRRFDMPIGSSLVAICRHAEARPSR